MIAKRAEKQFLGIERQIGDLAAVDLDAAVLDRARAVVLSAGNGDGNEFGRHGRGLGRGDCSITVTFQRNVTLYARQSKAGCGRARECQDSRTSLRVFEDCSTARITAMVSRPHRAS